MAEAPTKLKPKPDPEPVAADPVAASASITRTVDSARKNSARVMAAQNQIRRGSEMHTSWECDAAEHHSLADVCMPWYLWRRAATGEMKPGDTITIWHPSHAFYVRFYLIRIDRVLQSLVLKPMELIDLTEVEPISASMDGCLVLNVGSEWVVQQGNVRIKGGFKNEAEATQWLAVESARRQKTFIPV